MSLVSSDRTFNWHESLTIIATVDDGEEEDVVDGYSFPWSEKPVTNPLFLLKLEARQGWST